MTDADYLRKHMPRLPFAIRELIIGNLVVGNFTLNAAFAVATALAARLNQQN